MTRPDPEPAPDPLNPDPPVEPDELDPLRELDPLLEPVDPEPLPEPAEPKPFFELAEPEPFFELAEPKLFLAPDVADPARLAEPVPPDPTEPAWLADPPDLVTPDPPLPLLDPLAPPLVEPRMACCSAVGRYRALSHCGAEVFLRRHLLLVGQHGRYEILAAARLTTVPPRRTRRARRSARGRGRPAPTGTRRAVDPDLAVGVAD
jgi:hypothetical protein